MITPAYSPTATERVLPRMALDFTTGALDPRVTITRALNTATRINSSGLIEIVNANLPRFDYDPVTLLPKGLLIEELRQNLLSYSADFTDVSWVKDSITITSNSTISPDGTSNADTVTPNTSNTTTHRITKAVTTTAGSAAISVFVKQNGYSKFYIREGSGTGAYAVFDVANGLVITQSGGTGFITLQANGFYRVSLVFTAVVSSRVDFGPLDNGYTTGVPTTYSYAGNGVSGVILWGAQIEQGAFVTSYIPTTTTSLTRNADAVSMTGTNFSDWYNATEGTLFAEASTFSNAATDKFVANINNNGFPNRILLNFTSLNNFSASVVSNSVTQVTGTNGTAATLNTPIKMCFATKLNSFAFSQSGVAPTTSVSGAMPVTVDRLWIGGANTTAFLNGHMRQIKFWPQRLTNAEVQAFSK